MRDARTHIAKTPGQKIVRQGEIIGFFNDRENTFTKHVKESKHLYRVRDSWGIDGGYFYNVLLPRNAQISIKDVDTGIVYETDAKSMDAEGFDTNHAPYGAQRHLTRSMWKLII